MRVLFEPLAGALGLGGITRCLALASAAASRGHVVGFHSQPYPLLDQFPIGKRFDSVVPKRPAGVTDPQSASFSEALSIRGVSNPDYLEAAVKQELSTIEQFRPDVMVTEWQPSVPISAHESGVPFVATLATTELSRMLGDGAGDVAFSHVDRDVLAVAARYGIDGLSSVDELLHTRSLVNLAPTVPELEPFLASVPRTHFVGPLLFPPLELRQPDIGIRDAPRKVVVYLGTGAVSVTALLDVLVRAFPEPEYEVLVAAREAQIDGHELPFRRGSVVVAHEPGLMAALQGCDVAVLRGSQNAVAACLMAGVPIVGVPGDRDSEPRYNMKVLAAHRCGVMLEGTPSAVDIAEAAQTTMSDGSSQRAAALGASLRRGLGPTGAIAIIEQELGVPM